LYTKENRRLKYPLSVNRYFFISLFQRQAWKQAPSKQNQWEHIHSHNWILMQRTKRKTFTPLALVVQTAQHTQSNELNLETKKERRQRACTHNVALTDAGLQVTLAAAG